MDAKKFMYCHGNVLNWDDSAGEEAFQSAKKRFWADINGLPCDISLPDPDTYIDEINWNPDIDSELIKDLERELFVPNEGVNDCKVGRRRKRSRNMASFPSDGCNRNPGDVKNSWECDNNMQHGVALKDKAKDRNQWGTILNNSSKLNSDDNPWERSFTHENEAVKGNTWENCGNKLEGWNHSGNLVNHFKDWDKSCNLWECDNNMQDNNIALKDKAQGWNQWGTNLNNSSNLNSDDLWERCFPQGNEVVKSSTWEDWGNKLWGWNPGGNHVNQMKDWNKSSNPWEHSCQGVSSVKDKGWSNFGDSSWGQNQQESRKFNNGSNSWETRFVQGSGTPKDRGWRDRGSNSWGCKQWDNYSKEPKAMEFRKLNGGWGAWNQGCQKREGAHQYITGYKTTRFREDDYQTGHSRREGKAKKRVSFA